MRSLATLGLIILSVLPLAARDHDHDAWRERGPRRGGVLESRAYRDAGRWDRDRCDDGRWEWDRCERNRFDDGCWDRRPVYWHRRPDCDDVVVVRPRPLAPPWRSQVVLRFGW
jgi:hypothetical protein